ncbi:hypothetical protein VTL71DRAFT_9600 [Oculimacula yallundae]|uniref:Rhodopsin domain-containing protein n=1 Tax=Oculimacula yallundae TaxID=86028 RepID=A0ABR4BRB2_9HELO
MAAVGLGQVVSWYICTIVAIAFLSARFVVKWMRFKAFSLDDGFLALAGACLITDLVIQQHMWNLGMATPQLASKSEFEGIMQMIIPGSIAYVTSLWAIKIALVIFYKRIAARTKLQTVYNVVLGVLAVTWAVIFFDIIFLCYPIERKWKSNPECSKKASDINYWITILANIFSDVVIMILPISMVAKLQMPLKQKLGVAAMFALGFFVIIASIIRAYYSSKNETMLTCTVSMVETAVAIIATCLPALRTVILGRGLSRVSKSSGPHYELGSSRHTKIQASVAATSRHDNYLNSGHNTSKRTNDSEDELVKDIERGNRNDYGVASSGPIDKNTIAVTREFQVHEESEKERGNRNMINF